MFTVYLASPIDYRGGSEFQTKAKTKQDLIETGKIAVFDPETAWSTKAPPFRTVQDINMQTICRCDGVLAILPRGVLTVGTVLEIAQGVRQDKPTVVIAEQGWALKWLDVTVINPTANSNPVSELLSQMLDKKKGRQ